MTIITIIIYAAIAVVAIALGIFGTLAVQKSMAKSQAKTIIDEANREAEAIKKDKLLE